MLLPNVIQVMAFDFGLARIGVAIGNTQIKIAHPLDTITGKNKFEKLDKIAIIVNKWQPQLLIIGKPLAIGGKDELMANIQKFANRLSHKFKLPVEFIDEDYSSSSASMQLNEQNIFGRSQVGKLDQLAACNILDTYFSSL